MESILEEVGEYIWERKGYPYIGTNVVGTEYDIAEAY